MAISDRGRVGKSKVQDISLVFLFKCLLKDKLLLHIFLWERFLYQNLTMLYYCPRSLPDQKHYHHNSAFSIIILSSRFLPYCNIFQRVSPPVNALSHQNISKGCWSAEAKACQPDLELWVYFSLWDLSSLSPWP